MGNTSARPHPRQRNKKQVHWKAADRPTRPGKPQLAPDTDGTPDVITIRWDRPLKDGGSPIIGYLVEHRRTGSPHWVRASPLLVPFPELTLSGLEPGWRYQFRVSAENAVGLSDPSELSEPLTVTLQRSAVTSPRFVQELTDTTALENEKVEFVVYFLGQPPPKISWFKDGFEIFSSRRIRILTENDRSVLTIHQSQLVDAGEIGCSATNKAGHATTKAILVLEAPPSIRLPRQYEEGLLFEIGEVIRLKMSVAGLPVPLVFWSHNGESIQHTERYEIENTDNSTTLKITEATRSDRGEYQVKAVNKLGQDQASFLVTVTDKPSQPGKARVLMTLGRSVTLAWNTPEDDGGCKIGNYIIEYYRVGWDVWLKAATSRQLTTVLGDLIEGSQYKFRVKAESPYGISEPSEESESVFIPDTKRGILTPSPRSASQPKELAGSRDPAPELPQRKHKPRSQSSTRVDDHHVQFNIPNGVPVRPDRTKVKTPQRTPEASPRVIRRELKLETINKNIFDRASMTRDLSYGTPEFKVKKNEVEETENKSRAPDPLEIPKPKSTVQIIDNKISRSPSPMKEKSPSPMKEKSPSSMKEKSLSPMKEKSPSPMKEKSPSPMKEKSPSPMKEKSPSPMKEKSPSPMKEKSPSPEIILKPENPLTVQQISVLRRRRSPSPKYRSRSPSPSKFQYSLSVERSPSPTPNKRLQNTRSPSPNFARKASKDFTGSSEFMLVLLPNESKGHEASDIDVCFNENQIPPPLSLSAPELGTEPPILEGLKYSASSTELLHERAMIRFYEAAQAEEKELKRKLEKKDSQERRPNVIPKIQINNQDEEDILLERKASLRRRYSAGIATPQQVIWTQRRHSLRNSGDLSDLLENKLRRYPMSIEERREIMMNRTRSESEEKEEEEFEKVRNRVIQNRPKQKKGFNVLDLSKWDEYEESLSEENTSSEDERIYDQVPEVNKSEDEDTTYHPTMRTIAEKRITSEPFEILTKPSKLPDPNFVPKPILKRNIDVNTRAKSPTLPNNMNVKVNSPKLTAKFDIKDNRSSSPLFEFKSNQKPRSPSLTVNANISNKPGKRGSLPWSAPIALAIDENKDDDEKNKKSLPSITAVASISGVAAAGIVVPHSMLIKKTSEEEAKAMADHYADIVKSYGQKTNRPPAITKTFEIDKVDLNPTPSTLQTVVTNKPSIYTADNSRSENVKKYNDNLRARTDSSSSSQRSISPSKSTRVRRGSPTVLNKDMSTFRLGREPIVQDEKISGNKSPSRPRTPSKSPSRKKKSSESPRRWTEKRFSPIETSSFSTQTETMIELKKSPSPIPMKRAPKMKEIMTQTSACIDNFIADTTAKITAPFRELDDQELKEYAEKKVRSTVDYVTDLAMFIVACWLYLFNNELLAIPVLIVMVYRQLESAIRKRIPKWLLPKQKKET